MSGSYAELEQGLGALMVGLMEARIVWGLTRHLRMCRDIAGSMVIFKYLYKVLMTRK